MGFFRSLRGKEFDAEQWRHPRRLWRQCLGTLAILGAVFSAGQAQTSSPQSACTCQDIPDIQDRIQKLQAIRQMVLNVLGAASPDAPASQQEWTKLQSGIKQYLQYMEMQNSSHGTTGTTLFNNTADPFCGAQASAPTACMNDSYTVHQVVHAQSCHAGRWKWESPWNYVAMLQEETAALQTEIEFLQSIQCGLPDNAGTPTGVAPPTQTPLPGMCPQFQLNVQVVTTTAISMPGVLNEQSSRSLNNGQGISVPLVFRDDGSFEGSGSGSDAGSGYGASPGEVVSGRFGHMQSIAASGAIQPGNCSTQPCQPDVMHLLLAGGPSQQLTQMQARGQVNRDLQQTTRTGAAQMQFDLPAYVGGSAQRTLLANGIINSNMTVMLLQAENGTPALPDGSSLLYSMQQCKGAIGGVRSGGGGGVVIPGVTDVVGLPGAGGGSQNNPNSPVTISVAETIHVTDAPAKSLAILVNESIQVTDTASHAMGAAIFLNERIHVGDQLVQTPAISVTESIHVGDASSVH